MIIQTRLRTPTNVECGINILDVGHFASEQVTFFNVMERLKEKFSDVEFITSKVEEDPFSFY